MCRVVGVQVERVVVVVGAGDEIAAGHG
jgi:hypothetical protein